MAADSIRGRALLPGRGAVAGTGMPSCEGEAFGRSLVAFVDLDHPSVSVY